MQAATGGSQAQADIADTLGNLARLTDPDVLAQVLNTASTDQRHKLANAYEKGDAFAVGKLAGNMLANVVPLPIGAIGKTGMALEEAAKAAKKATTAEGVANAATGAKLVDDLLVIMEKPLVTDKTLSRLVNQLYRSNAIVGNGSTAAAVRQELATKQSVGKSFHSQKARDSIIALQKWLEKNPTASANDRMAAENIIRDMKNALRGK